MTINYSAALEQMREEQEVINNLELLHDACLKNMVSMHTGDPTSMWKTANFIKHIVTVFSAPAMFIDENLRKIESFLTDDGDHMGMGYTYAMQMFKHGRTSQIHLIAEVMSQSWDINYAGAVATPANCIKLINDFPAALIVYMCMLFPNASIGMISQIFTPPTRPDPNAS